MKYIKILAISLIMILSFQNLSFAYYLGDDTEYVWSETTELTANTEETGDFLDLSCESAILIEQTTRKDFV